MGKDIILVETVGVGQQEVDIINHAHTVLVVLVPMVMKSKPSKQDSWKLLIFCD